MSPDDRAPLWWTIYLWQAQLLPEARECLRGNEGEPMPAVQLARLLRTSRRTAEARADVTWREPGMS